MPRPAFHFTPRRNWMNDPNGLVYDRGLWHLFFQYNPEGSDWGNMSWGHATSPDLQHWDEHPVALRYRHGEQIYSGSIVATRGGDDSLLTAYYTSVSDDGHQAQSAATSTDGGYTWTPDPANPLLDRGTSAFRDPKVIRFADADGGTRWIMATVEADDRQVLFYSSADLTSWRFESAFGPLGSDGVVWECPDLVQVPVDDDPGRSRWVLLLSTNPVGDDPDPAGSSMHYVVGDFDGAAFTPQHPALVPFDHGRDFYAGTTFDSAPDGQAMTIGWAGNWRYAGVFPSSPWRGAMSLPRRLALRTIDGAPRLVQHPPAFVRDLLDGARPTTVVAAEHPATFALSGHTLVELEWDPAATGSVRLAVRAGADAHVVIEHDVPAGELRIARGGPAAEAVHPDFASTSVVPMSGTARARLLLSLDGPLLEAFAGDGLATATNLVVSGGGPLDLVVDSHRHGPITVSVADVAGGEDEDGGGRTASA